ncbi:MAG: nitroreductase family protein [Prevotella sp.]|nr:nitroreductase family protein [Prevotella sp.]
MMTLDEVVQRRQSIRSYDGSAVTKDEIVQMVKCAQMAPSWKNSQTSRLHVVLSADKLLEARQKGMLGRNFEKTEGVGALVVHTFLGNVAGHDLHGHPDNELGNGWGCYDAGAFSMLFQLKASELGFDTLVIGIRDADGLRTVLGIPEDEVITAAIAVGKRKEDANRPPRKPFDEIVRFY